MANLNKTPWEVGSIFICNKCGAKLNQPGIAEEVKSEIRKMQKADETQSKIRTIVSGCLGVCYPDKQTFGFMPINGPTEMYTTEIDKETIISEIRQLIAKKLQS